MHVVLWTSKGQRYAMPSEAIVEVIPVVHSRPIPGSAVWLIGLFNYRGDLLPLIEWSRLLGDDASEARMGSRIIVVRRSASGQASDLCGLLVDHVLGAERLDCEDSTSGKQNRPSQFEFLGPLVLAASGPVQLTVPSLLPAVE